MAKYNLGKVEVSSMPVSSRLLSWLRGDLCILCWGVPHGSHRIYLLAGLQDRSFCLPYCQASLSAHPLVSIRSGKYSIDWVQCDSAVGGGLSLGCHGYLRPCA